MDVTKPYRFTPEWNIIEADGNKEADPVHRFEKRCTGLPGDSVHRFDMRCSGLALVSRGIALGRCWDLCFSFEWVPLKFWLIAHSFGS